MFFRSVLTVFAAVATLHLVGPALAQSAPPHLAPIIEQARKEEVLRLAWGDATLGGPALAQQLIERMNKIYGLNLKLQFTPVQAMARVGSQLLVELQANQPAFADLYLATAAQIVPLLGRNMFVPIDWVKLSGGRIAPSMIDADGVSLRVVTGVTGALVNTTIAAAAPKDLFDFLKPEWKGRIATTVFGAGFDGLSAKDVWGEQKTLEFVSKLVPQVAGFINCTDTERVATGEFGAFVLDCVGDKVSLFEEMGAPIRLLLQPDATARRYFYMQVPRHARSQAAATLFILYLHSESGQAQLWNGARMDLADYPNSRMGQRLRKFEAAGVKFFDVTIPWWEKRPEVGPAVAKISKILATASKR